jgi:hypothetical protein
MNQAIGAAHSGGSCQIAFSYDKGETWVVVQNYEGDCPRVRSDLKGQVTNHFDTNQDYQFRIPETFPSGDQVIITWLVCERLYVGTKLTLRIGCGSTLAGIENYTCHVLPLRLKVLDRRPLPPRKALPF